MLLASLYRNKPVSHFKQLRINLFEGYNRTALLRRLNSLAVHVNADGKARWWIVRPKILEGRFDRGIDGLAVNFCRLPRRINPH